MTKTGLNSKQKRKIRVRHKLRSVSNRLRLMVHRSSKHIYAQIVDDTKGKTLVAVSDIKTESKKKPTKTQAATLVGSQIAKEAQKMNIKQVYFDRGHYKFHGRVKALAQAARENGLEF